MQTRVTKVFTFEAAHFLPGYDGVCSRMHGHTYRLEVTLGEQHQELRQPADLSRAMIKDFSQIKRVVQERIIDLVDHQLLNEITHGGFPGYMPTAENMVNWMFGVLEDVWGGLLLGVRLWETQTSFAEVIR